MAKQKIQRILVAIHDRDDGEIVLEKAHHLARHEGAALEIIRIIHEEYAELSIHDIEQSQELKTFLLQAEETYLEEIIEPFLGRGVDIESATVWHKSKWEAILDVARDSRVDLIIKSTDFPVQDVGRTPADYNLLRHSDVPVMMIKPINWMDAPVVLAALDATIDEDEDLNLRILNRADQLSKALEAELHVVNTFPSVEHWVGPVTVVIDFDRVRETVKKEITSRINTLANKLNIKPDKVHTSEGEAHTRIQETVEQTGAEVVVMGTHRRTGSYGVVMGNTSEKILHSIRSDVEILH
jgi:universal stress protein E